MAKDFLDSLIAQKHSPAGLPPCNDNLEGEGWTVHLVGVKITGDPTLPICYHVLAQPLQTHMAKKGILHADAFSHVDWNAMERVMEELALSHQLWAAKHVHGWCAVGKRMKQWQLWDSSTCPCCQAVEETSHHVVICPDNRMQEEWNE